jgi:hypothetical protein
LSDKRYIVFECASELELEEALNEEAKEGYRCVTVLAPNAFHNFTAIMELIPLGERIAANSHV